MSNDAKNNHNRSPSLNQNRVLSKVIKSDINKSDIRNKVVMLHNNLKIAWRSLWKSKFYTIINISGLAVGLATGIMLLLWVQNELSFDKFNTDHQNIYHLSSHFKTNGEDETWGNVPGPLAVFAGTIPGVQSVARINIQPDQVLSDSQKQKIFSGNLIACVDSSFFSIFSFNLLKGNKTNIFPNINSVVLTQSTAKKLFGNGEPMGKTIGYYNNSFTVTGVLQDFPGNSTLQYDAIFPMGFYAQQFTEGGGNGDWKTIDEDMGNYAFNTFVQLHPNASPVKAGQAFTAAYKKARNGDSDASFKLQILASIHLVNADGNNTALRMVQVFMLVVVLLLAIASINYINLSTARSLIRAKEVCIRKIIGATKHQLFSQFTIETFLLFCFATTLAIAMIFLLMPLYNTISGKTLSFSLSDFSVLKAVGLAVLSTLIASAIYPAILLSSFKPIESLKGKISPGIGIASFRKVLVVFQFSISVILLVCTILMDNQMHYIKSKNVGYDKSYVFSVPLPDEVMEHLDAVKTELKKQPAVLNVSTSDAYDFSNVSSSTSDIEWPGKPAKSNMHITQVATGKDFIPTMKIQFLEGADFSGMPADSGYYILNETAVKQMGLKPPYVGQEVSFHNWKGAIRGVVRDFNYQSLKQKISPLLFFSRWKGNILYIRTSASNAHQAITAAEKQYKEYAGNIPFTYNFLDKSFEAQYQSEQRSGTLFKVFAGIAIFISCLGLFGLATYTAQVKTREIGIRKVLGASVAGIVKLISKDFMKLVIIGIAIAIPVAWLAMDKWLQGFAYRINISWTIFLLAGITAVCIALFTISFQAIKAAVANPVKSLRTE